MTDQKTPATLIDNTMLETAFKFWFNDNGHLRSPFPNYIREPLRMKALDRFFDWTNQIAEKARKEINDEIVAEKFEEILFETAAEMVLTEDEKLTIRYPFMMRLGDVVNVKEGEKEVPSEVVNRSVIKRGDFSYMKVRLKNKENGTVWEREFELPE